MQDFRKLEVWKVSHQLTVRLYRLTRVFPKEELFGLTSQIRRSASSIGANIAEGCGRGSNADFARFLQIAFGSACELENHLILCTDLGYLSDDESKDMSNELIRLKQMISKLITRVRPPESKDH